MTNTDWTQPICAARWNQDYATSDRPGSLMSTRGTVDPELDSFGTGWPERCCFCNKPTLCGIYVRIDPATVPYPKRDQEQVLS